MRKEPLATKSLGGEVALNMVYRKVHSYRSTVQPVDSCAPCASRTGAVAASSEAKTIDRLSEIARLLAGMIAKGSNEPPFTSA